MEQATVSPFNTFLTKAEKQVGGLGYVFALIALLVFGYVAKDAILNVLNFGVEVVGHTIVFGIELILAIFMVFTLMNPRFWTEMQMLNYQFVRAASRRMMQADPFGRMRAFANEYLQKKWEIFNQKAVAIQSSLTQMQSRLSGYVGEAADLKRRVASNESRYHVNGTWTSEEMSGQFRIDSQRILFLEDAIKKTQQRVNRLTLLVGVMDKWRTTMKVQIETTRMTADFMEQDYKDLKAVNEGIDAVAGAMGQDDAARADAETRKYAAGITADLMARADVALKQLPELTAVADLKGDMAEDEIMRRLKQYDDDAQQALVQVQEDHRQIGAGSLTQVIAAKAEAVPARSFLK